MNALIALIQPARQSLLIALICGLAAVAAMVGRSELGLCGKDDGQRPFPYDNSVDSHSYLQIAQGQIGQVESPFSKRVLYPALGGWLARHFHVSLAATFLGMGLFAYVLLAFCVAELLRLTIRLPWLALLFLLTPQPLIGAEMAYMPDLFHMSLLALFLLLWWHQAIKSAFVVLFIAFITRENTLLACLFLGYVAWRRKEKLLMAGAAGVLGAGMVVTSFFAKWGLPNRHHMPDFLYLLGKVPYYFLYNLIGLRIWSDARPNEGVPIFTRHLPTWLWVGQDREIGLCQPEWMCPIFTVVCWLTIFGIGPYFLIWLWRRRARFNTMPVLIHFCFVYGLISFFAGPLLGDWVARLVGYGWPVFWIALPYWLARETTAGCWSKSRLAIIGGCFWLTSWWPVIWQYEQRNESPWASLTLVVFYFIVWRVLKGEGTADSSHAKPAGLA